MTTQQQQRQAKPSRAVRFIQVLTLWRYQKILTQFGAALGIVAFMDGHPSPFVVFPGVLVATVLMANAVCLLIFGEPQ